MKGKLIIVTDLGRLKAYRCEVTPRQTPRLEPLEEVCLEEAQGNVDEWVTDAAGRRAGSTQPAWGAPIADDHNLKLENERRLIRQISKHIEKLIQRIGKEGVWLAAQKEINHRIIDELPQGIRAQIEKNLACDLVKAHPPEVLEAFLKTEQAEAHA